MKQSSRSLPVLVAVLVASLVLGTVGSAVAASGLGERAVRKIAAKVVRHEAKHLKVKDSRKLGGRKPSAYVTTVRTIGIAGVNNAISFDKALPAVPPGTYQASVFLTASLGNSLASLFCTLYQSGSSQDLIDAYGAPYQSFRTVSATRTIEVTGTLHLFCQASSGVITAIPANPNYAPAQVSLLKVDAAPYAGTAARTGSGAAPSGPAAPTR